MLVLSAECPKPPGKREISDMNEDLGNLPKDQLHYLAHWLDVSQNSKKDKARIHSSFWKEIVARNCNGCALFVGENLGILIADVEELGNLASPKYISEDCERSPDNPKR